MVFAHQAAGTANLLHEGYEAAAELYREALEAARGGVGFGRESQILSRLSEACLCAGDVEGSRTAAEEAVAHASESGAVFYEIGARLALARALRATDPVDPSAVEIALTGALELVRESDARAWEPQIVEEQARLAAWRGDDAASTAGFARALGLYREIGASGHAARLGRELSDEHRAVVPSEG